LLMGHAVPAGGGVHGAINSSPRPRSVS
jgi:hypothetical protein